MNVEERPRASRRQMTYARMLDILLAALIMTVSMRVVSFITGLVGGSGIRAEVVGLSAVYIIGFAVTGVMWKRMRRGHPTPGQRIMGVRLVAQSGETASFGVWLAAYLGMAEGDDLVEQMSLFYNPVNREPRPHVFRVSTRAVNTDKPPR